MIDDTNTQPVRIWDAPTRLFHWLLALLILAQYLTGEFDLVEDMRWHFWGGYATLTLIVFRVLWGMFGSQTSRFGEFVRGPTAVTAYVRNRFSSAQVKVGHNPLGGWSVVALLLVLAAQCVTGLFASDDLDNAGVLAAHVSGRTVKLMTHWHHLTQDVLLVLIAIHIAAVLLYLLLRHENLITPMLSGRRRLADHVPLRFASAWRALALLLVSAAAVLGMVWYAG